jgi:exopolysaccharide production protein ExoY
MVNKVINSMASDASRSLHDRTVGLPRRTTKRLIDIMVSSVLIVTMMPVYLLISLSLACSGQSPLYIHTRVGRGGRDFSCLKFRTMRNDADVALRKLLEGDPLSKAEWEFNRKLRRDPRVTRIGKLLRATSLDELPQLFNIIIGQMSMVGPRPVTRSEFDEFYVAGDVAAYYCTVRPGLTGLWQVNGRSETSFASRIVMDAQYVQALSLRADLAILARTVAVVLSRKGSW